MMSVRGRRGIVNVKVIARFIRVSFLRAFMRVVFPTPPLTAPHVNGIQINRTESNFLCPANSRSFFLLE